MNRKTVKFSHCVFLFILQLIIAHWLGRLSIAMFSKWFDVILLVNVYVNICPTFIKTFRIHWYMSNSECFPQTTIIILHFVFWCYIFSFSKMNEFFLISILGWRICSVYFWARTLCKSYSPRKYLKFEFRCDPTIRGSHQLFRSFKNSGKYIIFFQRYNNFPSKNVKIGSSLSMRFLWCFLYVLNVHTWKFISALKIRPYFAIKVNKTPLTQICCQRANKQNVTPKIIQRKLHF